MDVDAVPTLATKSLGESVLSALLETSSALNDSLDLDQVLQKVAQGAAEVLGAEAGSVLLLNANRTKLRFRAAHGDESSQLIGQEFASDKGIAGKVALSGSPVLVADVSREPSFYPGIDAKSRFRTRSLMAVPLRWRGHVLGVVEVLNKRGPEQFDTRDLEILRLFTHLAAISVGNAQTHEEIKLENLRLRQSTPQDPDVVGASAALQGALQLCERVAPTIASVLLLGETGTGKELTARRIHQLSPRHDKPFIAINCAALPETLLESELFGHEAGAFTGATHAKLGRFELADRGTLFLDEIGDISLSTQIKLLRVLQEREFVRVGGTRTISCDVRIIAATNRDLPQQIEQGHFRQDLYYRLNVFPIRLPPLRERREDIPALVDYYVDRTVREFGKSRPEVTSAAIEQLCLYSWPGNIRELRNVIERALLLSERGQIGPEQLPREIAGSPASPAAGTGGSSLEGYEKAMIVKALNENDWNQVRTAKALGISRDNLRYRLRKYQIKRPPERAAGGTR